LTIPLDKLRNLASNAIPWIEFIHSPAQSGGTKVNNNNSNKRYLNLVVRAAATKITTTTTAAQLKTYKFIYMLSENNNCFYRKGQADAYRLEVSFRYIIHTNYLYKIYDQALDSVPFHV